MAEGGKKSDNKKGLLILLGVLCLAIVGLGVGIGVVPLRGDGEKEISDDVINVAEEFISDEPVDSQYTLDLIRAAEDMGDVELGGDLYESVIASKSGNIGDVLKLRISYSRFLSFNDRMDDSLNQLNLVDQNDLDVMQKIELYIAYRNLYIAMDDMDIAEWYDAEINRLMEENNISEDTEF